MKPDFKTHDAVVTLYIEGTKSRVCRELGIMAGAYDEMHYDLSYAWFEHRGYFEYTARVFLVSKTFHRWWNQQVAQKELEFMVRFGKKDLPFNLMRAALEETITEMDVIPARELLRQMHMEGLIILKNNPELRVTKIYRNGNK